jgi:hypothetical protein
MAARLVIRAAAEHRNNATTPRKIAGFPQMRHGLTGVINGNRITRFKEIGLGATENISARPDSWNFLMRDSHAIVALK